MQIVQFKLTGRTVLFCQSTDETIPSTCDEQNIYESEAIIAAWLSERSYKPIIKDSELQIAWNEFIRKSFKKEPITDDMVINFLTGYDNPEWIALTYTVEPVLHGDDPLTSWYVVPSDTVIENDSEQEHNH